MGQRDTIVVEDRNSLQYYKLKVASNYGIDSCNKLLIQFDLAKMFGLAAPKNTLFTTELLVIVIIIIY